MSRVGFVTDAERPGLARDDRLVVPPLLARGVDVVPAVWDDPATPWDTFDLLVVRSPWDYHLHLPRFEAWLDERRGARVANPLPILRWNLHKRYLDELEAAGVPGLPTVRLAADEVPDLPARCQARGWREVVVKPEVSAGGRDTLRGKPDELPLATWAEPVLVQPFYPSVLDEGELSAVLLGGALSHAVQKRPQAAGFLVQEEHGGSTVPHALTPDLRRAAETAFATAAAKFPSLALVYGRADFLRSPDGQLHLVELELVEPELYLRADPGAPARFAAAIAAQL